MFPWPLKGTQIAHSRTREVDLHPFGPKTIELNGCVDPSGKDLTQIESLEPGLAAFAQAYIRRIPEEHVAGLPDEEVFAEMRGVFDFVVAREPGEVAVRVFNPDLSVHGFDPGRTVVDIVVDDSPFLVDSVRAAIETADHKLTLDAHAVIGTERDDNGRLVDVGHARTSDIRESVQHYVLERSLEEAECRQLASQLNSVLSDVGLAVADFQPMQNAVDRMMEITRQGSTRYDDHEVSEAAAFLQWLKDLNFVFLGYREYSIGKENGKPSLAVVSGSGLGILSDTDESKYASPVPIADLPENLQERYAEGFLLVVAKTNRISTVHRPARMDYVGIRMIGPGGEVVGEARMVGLFTSRAYMAESASVPILRDKLKEVLEAEDVFEGSHDYRAVVQMFNSFPKAELWSMPVEAIRTTIQGLLAVERKEHVRLFVSPDLLNRSVSLMVVLPRDRFTGTLRRQLQEMFLERYGGTSVDYQLSLGEEGAARIHFTVWVGSGPVPDVSFEDLQQTVVTMSRTWDDRVAEFLDRIVDNGAELVGRWSPRLPEYYKTSTRLAICAGDILQLESFVGSEKPLAVHIQNEDGDEGGLTRIAIYARYGKLELSEILPVLEALGLRVVEEVATRIDGDQGEIYIHDVGVLGPEGSQLDLDECGARVGVAIEAGLSGEIESDSLDRLVVLTQLTHHQVGLLRAYRTYRRRVSTGFTVRYVNDALTAHPNIAEQLVTLFEARFDPELALAATDEIAGGILADLEEVGSLDEDRILRGFLELIMATVRTNAYLPGRDSLSLKLWSAAVPDMPEPRPLYEIFVYARHVEGIHLRGGLVARGGIRWSDRREDYRAEVLGLMKAQMTKNAVIVPAGAKGGFVLRILPEDGDIQNAVSAAYRTFIRGLLDLTDNLVGGDVVPPPYVRRHDDDDPYLVVAADRGTAAFSDTANSIADDYGFWLRDAFASGGSSGYDHKTLGITARGAWESVKRHFLDVSLDVDIHPITVVGVGDMSGDVFGNGMLRSQHMRLVAAFDHRDIFIDPTPDAAAGFGERLRLFSLAESSWQDYDRDLISEGGGVWSRSEKSIVLTDEVRSALHTDKTSLTPDELIRVILRAPVDLLWNGGIGTYVKASWESNLDCHDRANDSVRVDAGELRCSVVGEGGNLGLSQHGRIEFARSGGRINTDFIDNSGGVDCSDREVNLKILLGVAEERDELSHRDRVTLVSDVTEDVTDRVLTDNYDQALILSQDEEWSVSNLEAYEDLMKTLERHGLLNRDLEGLPTSDEMIERSRDGLGLTRPELSVLLAYAKQDLKNALIESDVPDLPDVFGELGEYFPEKVTKRFGHLLADHPLRREILATVLASRVLNDEGITFVNRLVMETGATRAEVVPAYRLAHRLIGAHERWSAVEQIDADVDPALRRKLLDAIDRLVESITRWYLARPGALPTSEELESARESFVDLEACFADSDLEHLRKRRETEVVELVSAGIPIGLATRHVFYDELVHAPDIIELARRMSRDVREVAELFILIGDRYRLDWLERQVEQLGATTRWDRWAIRSLEGDLVKLRRDLAEWVLADSDGLEPEAALVAYARSRSERHARLRQFMQLLAQEGSADLDPLLVAARQIRALAS